MKFGNRIAFETVTTGSGDSIAIGAAVAKYQLPSAAGIADGDVIPYVIEDGADWEIGTSPYSSTGPSLTMRTVTESSNSGSRLNLFGGAIVFVDVPASTFNAAVSGPASAADGQLVQQDSTSGRLIKNVSMSGLLKLTSGVPATAVPGADYLPGTASFRNRIINPSGMIAQRDLVSTADGAYCFDRWIALTQSNPVTPSALTNVEDGTPYMMRLMQANASAQRFGLIQWLESANCIDLRGQSVFLTARVRMSASTTLRYAIVEWTGTADTITKDAVNDWTSGTFTTGNFFKSTTTTIVATGSIALTANTLASIALSGVISSSMNNLAVFFWTDSTQAQNVTLDIGNVDLKRSLTSSAFEARSYAEELALCMRYFRKVGGFVGSSGYPAGSGYQAAGGGSFISFPFSPSMRSSPTGVKNGTWNAVNCGQPSIQYTHPDGFTIVAITTATGAWVFNVNSTDDWLTFDAEL